MSGPASRPHGLFDTLRLDLGSGIRQARTAPGLLATIVLLLALGIGVNTAVFSVVKTVLLEPLPYDQPDQLTFLWETDQRSEHVPVSGPNFLDWRDQNRSFEGMAAFSSYQANLTGGAGPERVTAMRTTPGLLALLRARPALGRTFLREEEQPGHQEVVVISHALWQQRLGGDPLVVGKDLIIDGSPSTIVGVMPRGFWHPDPWADGRRVDVWRPMPVSDLQEGRDGHWLVVLGRLEARSSLEAAQQEMAVIAAGLESRFPDLNKGAGARVVPAHEELVGDLSLPLTMLLGAAALVLLIVCANVAGLLMARGHARQTELALRAALGASRSRLVRQLLTENLPLILVGGGGGVLAGFWAIRVMKTLIPIDIPRAGQIGIDGWVLGFSLALTLTTGLIFGLAPALAGSRAGLTDRLKQGRGGTISGPGSSRARNALVVAQFALTLVLANGAALMLQSYWHVRGQDFGFARDHVLTMRLALAGPRYETPEQVRAFYDQVVERVEALPGVRAAGAVSRLPLEGGTNFTAMVEGQDDPSDPNDGPLVEVKVATPRYLDAMGIPLLAGRLLEDQDSHPGTPGVLVNETMARRVWPNDDPIGKRFGDDGVGEYAVVGVVGDTRQWGAEAQPISEAYFPYNPALPGFFSFTRVRFLVVRTEVDPASLAASVKREIWNVDSDLAVSDVRTTGDLVGGATAGRRFQTVLVAAFASMALLLAAAGIFGAMSYFVGRRTHEIGVRMALGANQARVLGLVLRRGAGLALVGTGIGLIGSLASTRVTGSLLYGVTPTDTLTVAGGVVFLFAVGLFGSWVPAGSGTHSITTGSRDGIDVGVNVLFGRVTKREYDRGRRQGRDGQDDQEHHGRSHSAPHEPDPGRGCRTQPRDEETEKTGSRDGYGCKPEKSVPEVRHKAGICADGEWHGPDTRRQQQRP